jgi:putative transposase
MTEYRRYYVPGAAWFFTVNLARRRDNRLLIEHIESLRRAFGYVKERHPFRLEAIVVLPEHLHCIWTLPPDEADFSLRWRLLKSHFSRAIPTGERLSASRAKRGERGLWQRRFWAHLLRGQADYNAHCDYIHWNPVKHGLVSRAADWPHSTFHHYAASGAYTQNWGHSGDFPGLANEYLE